MNTYSQLKVDVDLALERDDVASDSRNWGLIERVSVAELSRDLRIQEVKNRVMFQPQANGIFQLPSDFIQKLTVDGLEYRSPDDMPKDCEGEPTVYTIVNLALAGNTVQALKVSPQPQDAPQMFFTYFARVSLPRILENHYDLTLMKCLEIASGLIIQEFKLAQGYAEKYRSLLSATQKRSKMASLGPTGDDFEWSDY